MAKKVDIASNGLPDLIPLADAGQWRDMYPLLAGYMTDSNYDDGSVRRPGRLFITAERGNWSATLKDPDQAIELTVATSRPEELWAALEAALSLPKPPWRADQWAKPRPGKRNKV